MANPAFTTANVNAYLAGVQNDLNQLVQLRSDIEVDLLGAVERRFDLEAPQREGIIHYVGAEMQRGLVQELSMLINLKSADPSVNIKITSNGMENVYYPPQPPVDAARITEISDKYVKETGADGSTSCTKETKISLNL